MLYKLTITFKKDYDIEKINILDFFKNIKESFNVISKEYVFLDNNVSFNDYVPDKINCFLEFIISFDGNNIDELIKKFLSDFDFILDYILIKLSEVESKKDEFSINSSQINNLVNNIDKLFYIRKDLQEMSRFIRKDKKDEYYRLIKNLSLTKYYLKDETFNLRMINVTNELQNIQSRLVEYAKTFGIDFQLNYDINNTITMDKILFFAIKPSLISLLYAFIHEENEKRQRNIEKKEFIVSINFIQDFNKIKIIINNPNIQYNLAYTNIAKNDFYSIKENELELSFLNYKHIIESKDGRLYIDEDSNIVTKLPLNFLTLNCYIIKTALGYFAIDKTKVINVFKYNKDNVVSINNVKYFKISSFEMPILNSVTNPKFAIQICIKLQNFILLVNDVLYEEKIFVRPIENDNNNFIGECLLKDTKKAYILNLASYLERR
ncbi:MULTISPECIES: hypothetical protein [Sneathia]|jgi:hypothetical protein|uniref:hypothetical protein n=1 Tax=Sneathia TaxID=168808 RepID=UPI001866EBC2|nr:MULTISPECIES: hypothetical protein [Sneathia]MBE3030607.1 hypothetical protein [Sneathia sp. DSM 16631]MDK9582510.1 hypothetical protein [Sneathia vaginalis]